MNELDGEQHEERRPITLAPNIDFPVWLQINQDRGWTMDGTIELFNQLKGSKELTIGPYPPMLYCRLRSGWPLFLPGFSGASAATSSRTALHSHPTGFPGTSC